MKATRRGFLGSILAAPILARLLPEMADNGYTVIFGESPAPGPIYLSRVPDFQYSWIRDGAETVLLPEPCVDRLFGNAALILGTDDARPWRIRRYARLEPGHLYRLESEMSAKDWIAGKQFGEAGVAYSNALTWGHAHYEQNYASREMREW